MQILKVVLSFSVFLKFKFFRFFGWEVTLCDVGVQSSYPNQSTWHTDWSKHLFQNMKLFFGFLIFSNFCAQIFSDYLTWKDVSSSNSGSIWMSHFCTEKTPFFRYYDEKEEEVKSISCSSPTHLAKELNFKGLYEILF